MFILMYFFPPLTASANAFQSHTSALDDLKKDSTFDITKYPSNPESNEIQVIHIGEGLEGELYIYTYQPGNETKHYKAKFINMALQSGTDKNVSYKLYSLTWINSEGVFDKYIVNDFTITEDVYRYYTISAIYRLYDKNVDTSSNSEAIDTVQCRAFPVAQMWCLYYYNNILIYEMETMEYVDITIHSTGTIRYYDGFSILFGTTLTECDAHYVAFSIDNFEAEKIYDADITYTTVPQTYRLINSTGSGSLIVHEEERQTVTKTLTDLDTGSNKGTGLFGKKYEWNRISTVTEFVENVEADSNDKFSTQERQALNNSDFVFRFLETEITQDAGIQFTTTKYTKVENIGILRLHFLSEGKVYNLGVVGDLVGTDTNPELGVGVGDNIQNSFEEQPWWQKIISLLLLLILIVVIVNVIFPVVRPIFKIVLQGLLFIIDALLTILIYPFKLMFRSFLK